MKFKITDKCIGCGICDQACRVGSIPPGGPMAPRAAKPEDKAIQKIDGKYVINEKCIGCAGCVACCPVGAIIAADDEYVHEAHDEIVIDADLVVIGAGGAGLVSAVLAADISDKKVVVLEKMPFAGGGAKFAADWRVFQSKWQKERGLPDELNRMLVKGMEETMNALDPKLVYNALRNTGHFFDWFQTLVPDYKFVEGIYAMDRSDPQAQRVPFVEPVNGRSPNGTFYVETLEAECHKRGIPLLYRHRVTDIEMTDGKVSAVIAQDPGGVTRVNCKACVMASGSWIRNEKIMKEKFPDFWKALPTLEPSQHASQAYTGDGIALAEKAGAFIDYDSFVLRCMGPLGQIPSSTATAVSMSPKCIWVNLNGMRWLNELTGTQGGMSGSLGFSVGNVLSKQPKGINYYVFDKGMIEKIKAESPMGGMHGMPGGAPEGAPSGMPMMPGMGMGIPDNYLDELIKAASEENGKMLVMGNTIEELAANAGINAENLKATIENYNAMCAAGADTELFKDSSQLVPFTEGPYFAAQGHLNHDGAFGGVLIDPDTRAYRPDGSIIENLFVPGDFASGRYIVRGGVKEQVINDLGWAISSGYTAGKAAVEYLVTV